MKMEKKETKVHEIHDTEFVNKKLPKIKHVKVHQESMTEFDIERLEVSADSVDKALDAIFKFKEKEENEKETSR